MWFSRPRTCGPSTTTFPMLSPLAFRTYRHLFAAQVTALIGTGLSTVALALLAYDLAGGDAGFVLGTALALKMVAYVGIAPLAGGFADRVARRRLLVGLDLARAGLVACLPLVSEVWQVFALIFLISACSASFTPTFQATIPDVLEEPHYTRALSLSRLAYDLENLLSPALAGLALLLLGYDALFALNALAFLVSALLVLSVRLPAPAPAERGRGGIGNATFGIRAYLATPRLRGVLALSAAVAAAGAMVIVNTVVYVRAELGGSESQVALALAASGAGSMLVALALPRLLDRIDQRRVMLAGGGILALGLALGLLRPDLTSLVALWFLLGAGLSLVQTPIGRVLRDSCRTSDRPAYFAAQFALSHACWLITYPLAGALGSGVGTGAAFAVLAAIVALAALVARRAWPAPDPVELEHRHGPLEHEHLHVHDEHHRHAHAGWEGPEPHSHPHRHAPLRHRHAYVIDLHHRQWPA
ncbi:MAG TPA: MFS transporter [Geminicoccaceae bacterium]